MGGCFRRLQRIDQRLAETRRRFELAYGCIEECAELQQPLGDEADAVDNLHLGHAPEFRGSSPAFYELLEGVPAVGVTIHRVSEKLDAGPILLQESFPLDLVPEGDPVSYVRWYQAEVLVPNGVRMMAEAVRRLAHGRTEERGQPPGTTPTRRRATYRLKRELRHRIAMRRADSGRKA